jgi:hypothetical protein
MSPAHAAFLALWFAAVLSISWMILDALALRCKRRRKKPPVSAAAIRAWRRILEDTEEHASFPDPFAQPQPGEQK